MPDGVIFVTKEHFFFVKGTFLFSVVVSVLSASPEFLESALRTPEERHSSGAPKDEFGRMIFEKNLPWETVLKFSQSRWQLFVEVIFFKNHPAKFFLQGP